MSCKDITPEEFDKLYSDKTKYDWIRGSTELTKDSVYITVKEKETGIEKTYHLIKDKV